MMITLKSINRNFYLRISSTAFFILAFIAAPPKYIAFDTVRNVFFTSLSAISVFVGIFLWALTEKESPSQICPKCERAFKKDEFTECPDCHVRLVDVAGFFDKKNAGDG